jgi:Tfp pilus assembly major pilin PilA
MATVKVIGSYANKVFIAAGEELQVYAMQYDTITVDGTLTKLNGDLSGGTSTFIGLTDTPNSYSGHANKVVSVKSAEDGLEFKVVPQGTGSQNQVVFWDVNNMLKAITGIEYDSDLDAMALIGDTIYGDYGETFWSRGYVDVRRITDSYNPFLAFWRSRQSGNGAVQNNDLLGRISALGYDGTGWSSGSRVRINLRAAQNWSSTAQGTKLDVEVTPTGSTTPVTAVTVDENGIKNERTNTVRTKDYTLTVPGTGTAVLGSGTSGYLPKFTGTNAIGNSVISETSDGIQIQTGKTLVLNGYGLDTDGYFVKFPYHTTRDHFTTSSLSSYWDGWTTIPAYNVVYNARNHLLAASPSSSQTNITCFLYKSQDASIGNVISAWCAADSNYVDVGIRIDNGYIDNNSEYSVEFFIKGGVGTYFLYDAALFKRERSGATITETQLSSTFPGCKALYLMMAIASSSIIYLYGHDDVSSNYTASASYSFTPTRHGIFVRNRSNTGPRTGYFHFYQTSF